MLLFEPVDLQAVYARVHAAGAPLIGTVDLRAISEFLQNEGVLFIDSKSRESWKHWRARWTGEKRPRQSDEDGMDGSTQGDASDTDSAEPVVLPLVEAAALEEAGPGSPQHGAGP